eukprot:Skav203063  [mRNA]  locus=scaffold4669:131007:131771:+ [translate_table: standard]
MDHWLHVPDKPVFDGYWQNRHWQAQVRSLRWTCSSVDPLMPYVLDRQGTKTYIFLHLFSGRRRFRDFHHYMKTFFKQWGGHCLILSLDTANSPTLGDLRLGSESWKMVEQCLARGMIAGTLAGPPCETFSEARFTPGPADACWPRPLRSWARLYGLDFLSWKELRQLRQGSEFFLQTWSVLAHLAVQGGLFLGEPPAPPVKTERPSVFTYALTDILKQHPDIHIDIYNQWMWRSKAVKPTGIIRLRVPQLKCMM